MKKFWIEAHWDGDEPASFAEEIEAVDQDTAEGEALLKCALDADRIEFDETDGTYEGVANSGMTREEAVQEARDYAYIDSCTEVAVGGFANHSPLAGLFAALDELLDNREHLDLHDDDRAMITTAYARAKDWWVQRSDVS